MISSDRTQSSQQKSEQRCSSESIKICEYRHWPSGNQKLSGWEGYIDASCEGSESGWCFMALYCKLPSLQSVSKKKFVTGTDGTQYVRISDNLVKLYRWNPENLTGD